MIYLFIFLGIVIIIILSLCILDYFSDVKTFNKLKCPDCKNSFGKAKFLTTIYKESMHLNFGEYGSIFTTSFRCYCRVCKKVKLVNVTDMSHIEERIKNDNLITEKKET